MEKIAEDIQLITGIGTTAVFVVNSADGFILIDTGIFKQTHLLRAELENNHYPLSRLQLIVLAHCHCDHIGGVTELLKYSSAKVAAHADDIPYIFAKTSGTGIVSTDDDSRTESDEAIRLQYSTHRYCLASR
jgi:glyoxylase-like metal-dependent hydrolase (beta-lactamase superfamily II)